MVLPSHGRRICRGWHHGPPRARHEHRPRPSREITIHQELKLRVEPDGELPFEVTVKQVFNDSYGWHIPQEGYSVAVLYDPKDHSKVVLDLEAMPVAEAVARHEKVMARMRDPEARRQQVEEMKAKAAAQAESAAAIQETMSTAFSQAPGGAPGTEVADQLSKLADLRNRGVLTDAEFEVQKAKLLGGR